MVNGRSNKPIAEDLGLSEKSIEFNRAKMMEKCRSLPLRTSLRW